MRSRKGKIMKENYERKRVTIASVKKRRDGSIGPQDRASAIEPIVSFFSEAIDNIVFFHRIWAQSFPISFSFWNRMALGLIFDHDSKDENEGKLSIAQIL